MANNFPPMPRENEFAPRDIETFDIGQIYKKQNGERLFVVGTFIFGNTGNYTGTVSFRDDQNELIKLDEKQLKDLIVKRIF